MPDLATAMPPAWIVAALDASDVRIFGSSPQERLTRSLESAACSWIRPIGERGPEALPTSGPVVLMRGDAVYDERVVRALLESRDTLLLTPAHGDDPRGRAVAACVDAARVTDVLPLLVGGAASQHPVGADWPPEKRAQQPVFPEETAVRGVAAGLKCVTPEQLVPAYNAKLRKVEPPFLFYPVTCEESASVEEHAFRASYKGLTDLVTRWVWPTPALAAVRVLARRRIHPNTVTLASWVLAVLAFTWFWQGHYLAGLVGAWGMTFLDTVDGKLARCTLTSSRLGHVLDHGLDLVHPPFWWLAWGAGLATGAGPAAAIAIAGYFVGRILEGIFLAAFKFETHSWRPIDGLFRTITARRNPNLILLSVGAIEGRPDLGMVMVAIWTIVSLGFHAVRVAQAFAERSRGGDVSPWNEDPG